MKYFLTLLAMLTAVYGYSQAWFDVAPGERQSFDKSFFSYQKAFEDHWAGKDIELGYYYEGGIKKKAFGWKQFKRWESFWETRVNPDGSFPSQRQYDVANMEFHTTNTRTERGNWINVGPSSSSGGYAGVGRINQIEFHPTDPNTFWVTTPQGGLWKTSDNGLSWLPLTEELDVLACTGLGIPSDYETSQTIYLGTGNIVNSYYIHGHGIGILKSVDGGDTWLPTGLSFESAKNISVNRILIHPDDNNYIYAATENGIYVSRDAAETWEHIFQEYNVSDLEFDPSDPSVLYGSNLGAGKIYKISDNGNTIRTVYNRYMDGARRIEIAVAPSSPNIVYAVVSDSQGGLRNILKSTDSGENYMEIYTPQASPEKPNLLTWNIEGADTGGQGNYDLAIAVDPNDHDVVYVSGINTWRSQDGGQSWSIVNYWTWSGGSGVQTVHADKHFLKFNGNVLFECNDGGLYRSQNGTSWEYISNGIRNSQIYKIGVSQATEEDVITGLQDNGSKSYYNGNWFDVIGGDGMDCMIDHQNPDIQYGELYYGRLYRTMNHWGDRDRIQPEGVEGYWITPLAMNPVDPAVIYAGYRQLYKSKDRGENWETIFNFGQYLRHVVIAPADTSIIVTGDLTSLWKTEDSGANWTKISKDFPNAAISGFAVHNSQSETMWVTFGGFNEHGIYQSDDGGKNWYNISAGLPDIPVNTVVHNGQNSEILELYVGTDYGVYFKLGEGDWTRYSNGMPKVITTELEIHYDTIPKNSRLWAGTWGRGLWKTDLYSVDAPPVADFTADKTDIFIGQTVNYTDQTTHTPYVWEWTFEGGTPAYSTKSNPSVSYNEPGIYEVRLAVSNGTGLDTIVKTGFISVSCDSRLNYLASKAENLEQTYFQITETGTVIEVANDDDANSLPVPIGFDFEYNCNTFSSFILNTNGFIKLGDTAPSGVALFFEPETESLGGPFNSENPLDNFIISPFNYDLTGDGTGKFTVLTEGEAPHRVCTIEFSNLRDKNNTGNNLYESIEFQIKLHETSNIIDFVFGDWVSNGNPSEHYSAACGLKGIGNGPENVLLAEKSSDTPWSGVNFQNDPYSNSGFAFDFGNMDKPVDNGRTFRFIPKYFRDLHIKKIFALTEVPGEFGTPENIRAIISNDGLNDIHNIKVTVETTGASHAGKTVTVDVVKGGEDKLVSLGTFQPNAVGHHTLTATLQGDDYNADNTMSVEQETTIERYNYADVTAPARGIGFDAGDSGNFFTKFYIGGTAWMNKVNVFIFDDPSNVQQQIMGSIHSTARDTTYFSDTLTIEEGHLGQWLEIQMPDSVLLRNEDFYAGIYCLPSNTSNAFAPLGVQTEIPTRPNAFYQSSAGLQDTLSRDETFGYRYMIGTTLNAIKWTEGDVSSKDSLICAGEKARVTVSVKPDGMEWQVSDNGLSNWSEPQGGFGLTNKTYLTDNLFKDQYYRIKVPVIEDVYAHSNAVKVEVAPSYDIKETVTLCTGRAYTFPDGYTINNVFEAVEHTSQFSSVEGCDSLIRTTLELLPAAYIIEKDTICKWDDYVFQDGNIIEKISADLLYEIAYPTPDACDSILATQIIVEQLQTSVSVSDTALMANLGNASYQWLDCETGNQPIAGATDQLFIPESSGTYAVIIDNGNCVDTSGCIQFIHLNTEDFSGEQLMIYPNPSAGKINLKSSQAIIGYKIYDIKGRVIADKAFDGLNNLEIILEEAAKGMYIIEVKTTTKLFIEKLLME
jgi:PKD repeat protein